MTIRLDGLYDTIVEFEELIEDARLRRSSIEMEAITLDNVHKIIKNFGKLYAIISDEEKSYFLPYKRNLAGEDLHGRTNNVEESVLTRKII